MEKEPTTEGKAIVRTIAIAWTFYGAVLDDTPESGIVFAVLGLLLLLYSEFAMDAFEAHASAMEDMEDKHRMGWW